MSYFFNLLNSGGGGSPVYDVDYQAILTRATVLGYTLPSDAQKLLQNNLVIGLKSAGIWTGLDVLYIYATDGDSDFATLNWKNPLLYQCTKVNSPTFTTNQGFTGNGTTSYLDTNWSGQLNGVNFTRNNASLGLYVSTNVSGALGDIGVVSTGGYYANTRNSSDQVSVRMNMAPVFVVSGISTSIGFLQVRRTSVNMVDVVKNGVIIGNSSEVSSNISPGTAYVGAINTGAFSSRQIGMAFFGNSLTGLEVLFYNLWNTYFTSL